MFVIGNQVHIRRFHAARLLGCDHRTLRDRAAAFGFRTVRLPGQRAELYHLLDVQQALEAARRPNSMEESGRGASLAARPPGPPRTDDPSRIEGEHHDEHSLCAPARARPGTGLGLAIGVSRR